MKKRWLETKRTLLQFGMDKVGDLYSFLQTRLRRVRVELGEVDVEALCRDVTKLLHDMEMRCEVPGCLDCGGPLVH